MSEPVERAWWCPSRDRLARGAPREGDFDTYDGPLEPGRSGLHASALLLDALAYGETPIVCRVELEGEVVVGVGQRCAHLRRVLWTGDVTKALEDLAATTLPVLVRRVVEAWGGTLPPELLAIAEARPADHEAAADAALALREKADDARRDAEWAGKDDARIGEARKRAGAAHAAVLLTDETSGEAAHRSRTAERIADAAAWLAYSWEGASFDEERVIARTLVSEWLGSATFARRDEVDADRYARPSRPEEVGVDADEMPRPRASFVPVTELAGVGVFKSIMSMDRFRGPLGITSSCPTCGAVRRGEIAADAICLACGNPMRGRDVSKPMEPLFFPAPRGTGQAVCHACGSRYGRTDRPFDAGDTCPGCGAHEEFAYAGGTCESLLTCVACNEIREVHGIFDLREPCPRCDRAWGWRVITSLADLELARCDMCGFLCERWRSPFGVEEICPNCFCVGRMVAVKDS
jgi:hypothetical protein